ncbi:MAG: GAF domain-containing protein, partial [Acidobacteriota bacterium]|nr:GAF domain-containing protein [Acidobacteriota bacterium]
MEQPENRPGNHESELPRDVRDVTPPLLRLCHRYMWLAISAAVALVVGIGLNARLFQHLSDGSQEASVGETAHELSYLGMFSVSMNWLALLLLIGAVYYGFKIAKQTRLDAQSNERFLYDAQQRTMEIAALYDTTQDVSGRHELTPLLQNILERATNLLQGDGAAIFLYDAEHDDFQIAVERGVGMPIGAHLPLHEGLGGEVAKTLAPVIVNDYANWLNRAQSLKELPILATICVPMIRSGELIGVLGVHEVRGGKARGGRRTADGRRMFTEADAKLLSLFADNAAGAVHNARLLEELRCSEERFRIAAESTGDLVYDRDLVANTARFFRAQHESLWAGVKKLANTAEEFRESIHPDDRDRVLAAVQRHLQDGVPFSEEYRIILDECAGDSFMSVSDRAIAILDHDGKPIRLVGCVSDITERKRAEQLKSDFISFVTHQLRTPLSGVKWMLELAMDAKD